MPDEAQLHAAIAALAAQRAVLGDAVVEASIAALQAQLATLPPAVGPSGPPDQRKLVTVLFADVAGFTAWAAQHDAEDVHALMNSLWARLDAILLDHGGHIDKHIGDAVMAIFGTPVAHEDDAARACRAALALQATFTTWAAAPGQPAVALRIGIHSGPVVLGTVGAGAEFTAMGDTVNLASRLEHSAPVGGVLISQATYRQVRGQFDVVAQPPLTVKGKPAPLQTYYLERARPRPFQVGTRGVDGMATLMIGRDAELAALQTAFRAVVAPGGQAQAVTIWGEAGLGKTRLLTEFLHWVDLQPERVWYLRGTGQEATAGVPYNVLRDLITQRFAISESDPLTVARAKLDTAVAAILGAAGAEAAAFIGHLIGLDYHTHPSLRGILDDPRQIRGRAFHALARLVGAQAAHQPILLVGEDLHWADSGSLEGLEYLLRECRAVPLLLIGAARPDLAAQHVTWKRAGDLHLEPLGTAAERQLVRALLGRLPVIPPELEDLVVARAGGNPFYAEEIVNMLVDEGVLRAGDAAWRVVSAQVPTRAVPATLVEVIQARVDRLSAAEQAVVRRAAVVGMTFWDGVVAHLGGAAAAGGAVLERLQGRAWVYPLPATAFAGEREYQFKHAVLQAVVYEGVLKRERQAWHRGVAAWLVARSGERATEWAGVIAEHYAAGGAADTAGAWYVRAGDAAAAAFAAGAAQAYYEAALGQWSAAGVAEAPRFEVLLGLGQALLQQAQYPAAAARYREVIAGAQAARDGRQEAAGWNGLADVQDRQGHYEEMQASGSAAVAAAQAAGAAAEEAAGWHNQGWGAYFQGDLGAAQGWGERGVAQSRAAGTRQAEAGSLMLLGAIASQQGRGAASDAAFGEVLAIRRALGDRNGEAGVLNNLGVGAAARGEYDAAVAYYRQGLAIAAEIGERGKALLLQSNLAETLAGQETYVEAEAQLQAVIAEAEGMGGTGFLAGLYGALAVVMLGLGRVAEAAAWAVRERARGVEQGQRECVAEAWRVLGQVAAQGHPVTVAGQSWPAAACFAESLRLYAEMGMPGEVARTQRAWARYELAQGSLEAGAARWAAARAAFLALGMPAELARMDTDPQRPDPNELAEGELWQV